MQISLPTWLENLINVPKKYPDKNILDILWQKILFGKPNHCFQVVPSNLTHYLGNIWEYILDIFPQIILKYFTKIFWRTWSQFPSSTLQPGKSWKETNLGSSISVTTMTLPFHYFQSTISSQVVSQHQAMDETAIKCNFIWIVNLSATHTS